MDTFNNIKEEFKQNGFRIDGDLFIHERVSYNTMNINGQVYQQPQKSIFKMRYICEGSIADTSDPENKTPLYQFDVLNENDEPVLTICIENFEDFTKLV